LEWLGEPVNVALPPLTALPPRQNTGAQQPQKQADYPPTHEEQDGAGVMKKQFIPPPETDPVFVPSF
jgi:hypothetical protein